MPGVTLVGHVAKREDDGAERKREIDEENGAPSEGVDQHAAHDGPGGARGGADRRPYADGSATRLAAECRAENRQAVRQEKGGADPLEHAAGEKPGHARRERTAQRRERKESRSDNEEPTPAVEIAGGAADQKQRAQWQQVGIHDPRERAAAFIEAAADRRQRDVDDRPVDKRQAGREDRGGENPPRVVRRRLRGRRGRAGDCAVTRWVCGHWRVDQCGGGRLASMISCEMVACARRLTWPHRPQILRVVVEMTFLW